MNINLPSDAEEIGSDKRQAVIDWSDQFLTGLDDVDDQHRNLIDIINKLGRLQAGEESPDQLMAAYDNLKSYTLYHFGHEEELMGKWPVIQANKVAHLKAHQGFIDRIGEIDKLILSHPSFVVDHLLVFLVKWLIHHISVVDMRMAKEIIALQSGTTPASSVARPDRRAATVNDTLSNALSDLYDDMGRRSLEIIDLNIRLRDEMDRRRHAEDEAHLASQVFHNSSEAMTVTDAENNVITINPAFTRLTGYLPEEIIGKNPNILSSGRHDDSFYREMWGSISATGHWDGELWNRHKNGEIYAESLTINTIYAADGSVDRRVAVFSDITRKKLTEEKLARQAIELKKLAEKEAELNVRLSQEIAVKNRLFSIISHDLRSPFTLLMGLSQAMLQKADSYSKEKMIEKAGTINRVSISVFNAVENLLDWSRAQLDGEKLECQQIAVNDIFEATVNILGPVATEKDIKLVCKATDEKAFADHDVVLTILRNLVSNAIKFTDSGGVVEVCAKGTGDRVEITVSDTGVGISEGFVKSLFAVDEKTTTLGTMGEKGTGLGLPLCADLAAKMGGDIRIESQPGKGSRFIVALPGKAQ